MPILGTKINQKTIGNGVVKVPCRETCRGNLDNNINMKMPMTESEYQYPACKRTQSNPCNRIGKITYLQIRHVFFDRSLDAVTDARRDWSADDPNGKVGVCNLPGPCAAEEPENLRCVDTRPGAGKGKATEIIKTNNTEKRKHCQQIETHANNFIAVLNDRCACDFLVTWNYSGVWHRKPTARSLALLSYPLLRARR